MSTAARLAALGTATVGEAWKSARIMDAPPRPLAAGMIAAGAALTVRCTPGDNLALHRAIAGARHGEVLVADYGGSTASAPFGEIMALACQMRGIAGLIIDGAVRDSVQIAALGFPVFAHGLNIRGTVKTNRGLLGVPLSMGGVLVQPGDMICADADGIIVIPADEAEAALVAAEARAARETDIMARLRKGETTMQILALDGEGEGT